MFQISIDIPDLQEMVDEEAAEIINDITLFSADRMKVKMAGSPRGGHLYGNHKASAPGEAPAVDTGSLMNSVMPDVDELTGKIDLLQYGIYLETGTSKMAARPFVEPSLDEVMTQLGF